MMATYIDQKMIAKGYTHALWLNGGRFFVKSRRAAFEKANHPDWLTFPACVRALPVDLDGMSDQEVEAAVTQWWAKYEPSATLRVEELG